MSLAELVLLGLVTASAPAHCGLWRGQPGHDYVQSGDVDCDLGSICTAIGAATLTARLHVRTDC